ncbi:MAG: RNA polymerase sigma factor [Candidatus Riflebacteria bacterium]|nr:RNA polymerase sigma factor [Candidatus Riflebacteria bacterium]
MTQCKEAVNKPLESDERANEEVALIEKLKAGDEEAYNLLIEKYSDRLFSVCKSMLGNSTDAEDAVQEILCRVYRGIAQLRGERLIPWILSITHNHCLSVLTRKNRNPEVPDTFELELPDSKDYTENQVSDELLLCLSSLSPNEREVTLLRVIEKLEYSEIAKITGYSEGSLRNVLARALKKLRQEVLKNGLR